MNILDPIFYRTLFYDFRPVITPGGRGARTRKELLRDSFLFFKNAYYHPRVRQERFIRSLESIPPLPTFDDPSGDPSWPLLDMVGANSRAC
jgi:hypothetical protein